VVRIGAVILSLLAALSSYALCDSYVGWVYRDGPGGPAVAAAAAAAMQREVLVRTVATRLVFAASWVIANLLLSFFAGMLLDAVDVMLLLYAVDRDHMRVSRNGEELHQLLSGMQVRRRARCLRLACKAPSDQIPPRVSSLQRFSSARLLGRCPARRPADRRPHSGAGPQSSPMRPPRPPLSRP
jgi:hypothetical protein